MKVVEKVNKKAYTEIKQIQEAHNMLEIESAINNAILKTFGLFNIGLMKIAMRDNILTLQIKYGCVSYNGDFNKMKTIREENLNRYKNDVKKYLMSFIPERMKITTMYAKMQMSLNN